MKFTKVINFIIFVINLVIFLVLIKLMYALGYSSDILNASPAQILNGDFNLILNWTILFLSFIVSILSFINLLSNLKK